MATCSLGHESVSTDFCDACGIRISPPVPAPAPWPLETQAPGPAAGQPPPGSCPNCGTTRSGQFCEACGFDFAAGRSAGWHSGAPVPPRPGAPAIPAPVTRSPSAWPVPDGFTPAPRPPASRPPTAREPVPSPPFPRTPAAGPAAPGWTSGTQAGTTQAPARPPAPARPAPADPFPPAPFPGSAAAYPPVPAPRAPAAPAAQPAAPRRPAASAPVAPDSPTDPAVPVWSVLVTADRAYYDTVVAAGAPDAAAISFPDYCSERRFRLAGPQMRIGRVSRSRGFAPEIDLTGPPTDPGVSRLHAVLIPEPDGSWAILDPGSENGTLVNDTEIAIDQRVRLRSGDRVHLGAWTVLTVQAG